MNFIGSAFAQTSTDSSVVAPTSVASTSAMLIENIAPMILIFVVFYFLMIRPQQKRAATQRAKIDSVKRGDAVVTSGGIMGKVVHVREQEVEVEIAHDVRVKVIKATLADVSAQKPL
jgi:preprotein translocase subunit YajC